MKKNIVKGLAGICVLAMLTGCGGNYVKLGEYKGIEAEKVICEISDQEVKDAVEEMMYDYVTYDEVTDRAAVDGDMVNVDYVITKFDGKPYESDTSDDEDSDESEASDDEEEVESDDPYSGYEEDVVLGEEYIYPEIEKALVGMKKGEKKTVSVTFTDDYADEDAVGKTGEFEVTLNSISVENTPEYNDEFVKEKLEYNSVAEYETALKEQLLQEKEDEYKSESVSQIMQKIIDNSTFSGYDKKMYSDCEEEYNSGNEQMAAMYGMELSDYEELIGMDDASKKEDILAMVHEHQVVEAIAKAENISVSDDDVNEFVEGVYEDYEYDSAEDFIKDYGMDYLKYYLTSEKVFDFLYDNAKLTEITEDEYNSRQASEDDETETDDGEEVQVNLDGDTEADTEAVSE